MKCEECGLESGREEIFCLAQRSFRTKRRTLCRGCFERRDYKTYRNLFWFYCAFSAVAALGAILFPETSLGPILLNVAAIQAWVFIFTVLHELGHVFAARLAGLRVFGIEVGMGGVAFDFRLWGFRWLFRSIPFGGFAHAAHRDIRWFRLRDTLFILGGPAANLMILFAAQAALPLDATFDATSFSAFVPFRTLLVANAMLLVYSLWPHRAQTNRGKLPNDGLLLWQTWRRSKCEIEQMPYAFYLYEAQECRDMKQYEEAQRWVEEGLKRFPRNWMLEMMRAANLLELKQYREARRIYVLLLGRLAKYTELRTTLLNNIAYTDILIADPNLLWEADACSREAFSQTPWVIYVKGTRGSVLVELGDYDEGLQLLQDAFRNHPEKHGQALNACYIAIGECRRGNVNEGRNYFSVARRLDQQCVLLDREARETGKLGVLNV